MFMWGLALYCLLGCGTFLYEKSNKESKEFFESKKAPFSYEAFCAVSALIWPYVVITELYVRIKYFILKYIIDPIVYRNEK